MTQPGWPAASIGALALTDLLGRWPAADGPLYRLLATRIARLADTGELPAGLRLPAERDLADALSVSRNTVAAAYQVLRGEWLRARYDALAGALRASLPGWTWPEPEGGLCLWARLPGDGDSGAFSQAALRHGVAVVPGRLLSASTEASSFVRLAFTQPPDVLRSAIRALAAIPAPSR